jgi:hypothetical protein
MKYIHKYVVDGNVFLLLSDKSTKPAGTFSLKQEDWKGRALGRFGTVVGQLNNLSWTKKDETPEEKEKKASIIQELDKIASEVEAEGCKNVALAIDQISDYLEQN